MMRLTMMFIAVSCGLMFASPARGDVATKNEALNVARNWVTLTTARQGSWDGSPSARVTSITPMKRGAHTLGYYCAVAPSGFVVVSYYKELGAVKAFSTTSSFDPDSDEGLADLVKGGMERVIKAVERKVGDINRASRARIANALEINYRECWTPFAVSPSEFAPLLDTEPLADYQEGQILLSTAWHQFWPYNDQCPDLGCTHPDNNSRAVVGCVATAGSEVMRYWHWPPYGEGAPCNDAYDWPNMPDTIDGSSSSAEIDAVAELCHEVGIAVDMDYGCGGSSASTEDMEGVYEGRYRFSTDCAKRDRPDYSAVEWFELIKGQININRATQYKVPGHSIVCHGWSELGDPVTQRWYYMNYGWQNAGANTWYLLDALALGDPDEEYQLINIVPNVAVGDALTGSYPRESFPYRYFDRDTVSTTSATFAGGQYLQSLAGITVNCTSTTGGSIRIYGEAAYPTRMYNRGDTADGIRIDDGCIKIMKDGGLVMH